jgi:hypothetical protein
MPAIIAVLTRILIYLGSMLIGAGITTAVNVYWARRRERILEERRKKRATLDKFKGFESHAHEHNQN